MWETAVQSDSPLSNSKTEAQLLVRLEPPHLRIPAYPPQKSQTPLTPFKFIACPANQDSVLNNFPETGTQQKYDAIQKDRRRTGLLMAVARLP